MSTPSAGPADVPSGTRLELRSRSGNELEQNFTYYDKNLKEVTARRWDKLIPSFRGPIDTTTAPGGDWESLEQYLRGLRPDLPLTLAQTLRPTRRAAW